MGRPRLSDGLMQLDSMFPTGLGRTRSAIRPLSGAMHPLTRPRRAPAAAAPTASRRHASLGAVGSLRLGSSWAMGLRLLRQISSALPPSRLPRRLVAASILLAVSLGACGGDAEADPRRASPESTVELLMRLYGVDGMSQADIQQHMRTHGNFELSDQRTFDECFVDHDGPEDEGLAGYVFGVLAAGKDELRVVRVQGRAFVYPNPERNDRYVVLVEEDEEWKVLLSESVPRDIQRRLREEYERIERRKQRGS